LDTRKIISIIGLDSAAQKQIRYYSSGMKQRVKLAQAIFSDVPVVLLDEPCTNLDVDGVSLYRQLVRDYCGGRLVIVSSNDLQEYEFCEKRIDMIHYR
jgi:ABC-type multidrug transport system ATPase subunit